MRESRGGASDCGRGWSRRLRRRIDNAFSGEVSVSRSSSDGFFGAPDEAVSCATKAFFGSPAPRLIGSIFDVAGAGLVLHAWFIENDDGGCGSESHSAENPMNRFHCLTSS